jgi:hypothetical protein
MCAAYVVAAPILSVAFNSAEPFDLNRLTSITPISMRSRVGLTGRVDAQRRSRESIRSPASASQKLYSPHISYAAAARRTAAV